MKTFVLSAALLAGALPSAEAAIYIVDPAQSYVRAHAPEWERVVSGYSAVTPDPQTGNFEYAETYNWQLNWTLQTYGLSGSFDLEREAHAWQPERAKLHVRHQNNLVTDAPAYAQFTLPHSFAQWGTDLHYDSGPCFDAGFYDTPTSTTYCSGFTFGQIRSDTGTLQGGTLTVQGGKPAWFIITAWAPDSPEPPLDIDYTPVLGLFEYRMVAVSAVPEPAAFGMMLAGLGMLALLRRRT